MKQKGIVNLFLTEKKDRVRGQQCQRETFLRKAAKLDGDSYRGAVKAGDTQEWQVLVAKVIGHGITKQTKVGFTFSLWSRVSVIFWSCSR